jgi:hypothetical protein
MYCIGVSEVDPAEIKARNPILRMGKRPRQLKKLWKAASDARRDRAKVESKESCEMKEGSAASSSPSQKDTEMEEVHETRLEGRRAEHRRDAPIDDLAATLHCPDSDSTGNLDGESEGRTVEGHDFSGSDGSYSQRKPGRNVSAKYRQKTAEYNKQYYESNCDRILLRRRNRRRRLRRVGARPRYAMVPDSVLQVPSDTIIAWLKDSTSTTKPLLEGAGARVCIVVSLCLVVTVSVLKA